MGDATRRRKKFLAQHAACVFCGGGIPATTIEHCPPRSLFQNRQWPEGMEFPSCETCNQGSRDRDLLVAVVARMNPFTDSGNRDGRLPGLMAKVNSRFPDLFRRMMPSLNEAKRANRELKLKPPEGGTSQDTGVIKIPREVREAVETLAEKLAKGLFYLETGSIFPKEGGLLFQWFTNADVLRDGRPVLFDLLSGVAGKAPALKRSEKDLRDQFAYKLSVSEDAEFFVLQASFGGSFGFVVFGSTRLGHLETIANQLRKDTGQEALRVIGKAAQQMPHAPMGLRVADELTQIALRAE